MIRARLLLHRSLLATTLALGACASPKSAERLDDVGLSYSPRNIAGPARWPAHVRRVAVLPAADATQNLPLTFAASYDAPWIDALQHSQRAEFVAIDRVTYGRWVGSPQPPVSTALLPADWASRIQSATSADAALLLDITHCSPYPPLSLGLRAKLVDLNSGAVLWVADETFDANNPDVARGARRHARAGSLTRSGEAIAVLQSPSKFAGYTMTAIAEALPPR